MVEEQVVLEKPGREYWQARVLEQEASGLNCAAFCRDRGISYHAFQYWRKRLGGRRGNQQSQGAQFREVRLAAEPEASRECLEVVVGAMTVRVPPGFAEADLDRVLAVVAERC